MFILCAPVAGLSYMFCRVSMLLNAVLPVLVALGVVYFVWGVVQYVIGDSDEAKKKGRDRIIFGLIGLAVIISIWGLVYILVYTFGVGQDIAPDVTGLVPRATGSACDLGNSPKLGDLLGYATCLIGRSIIPLLFAIAVIMFIVGVIRFFIIGAGEEAKRTQGKQFMIWAIVALAVMVTVWGLVRILGDTFNIDSTFIPQVKQ